MLRAGHRKVQTKDGQQRKETEGEIEGGEGRGSKKDWKAEGQ
jgi:hypothetical protein